MNSELIKRAIRFINENKRRKFWFRLGSVLAAVVVFVTTYALILPAITESNKTICGIEEHTHMYDCYDHTIVGQTKKMICAESLPEIHEHSDSCYDKDGKLVCGFADYIFHEHTDLCYDEDGKLVCTLEEHKKHTHTQKCYETKTALVCTIDESDKLDADGSENDDADSASVSAFESTGEVGDSGETTAHVHTSECYETTEILICDELCETHAHSDACYDGDNLICGKTEIFEHQHTETCFEMTGGVEKNTLICTKPEHTHSEDCYAKNSDETVPDGTDDETSKDEQTDDKKVDYSEEFTYEDSEISMNLTVEGDEKLPDGAEIKVSDLPKKNDEYKAYSEYAKENGESDSDRLITKSVTLEKDGETLDISNYALTAEVVVKDEVIEPIKEELETLSEAAPEALIGVEITPLEESDGEVLEGEGIVLTTDDTAQPVTLSLDSGVMAISAKATANPTYTVQYYAYIPTFATSGGNATLDVIDTSKAANNSASPVLPTNGVTPKYRTIQLKSTGKTTSQNAGNKTTIYTVATNSTLTEVYKRENYSYIGAPNPLYIDKLSDNAGYSLKEIWVLKSGKSADSSNASDWTVYGTDIHFTNREASAAGSDTVYITDETVIRLVYDSATSSFTAPTTFYDYNITNGETNSSGQYLTATAGINSKENFTQSKSGTTWETYDNLLAFGNVNTGTGLGFYLFDSNNYINKYNGNSAKGCTFGIAKGYNVNTKRISYDDSLLVANLFNEGSAKGKVTYEDSSITFERVADTYTISSVSVNDNGTSRVIDHNLQEFFNPSPKTATTHTHIFTNNFWPMDTVSKTTDPIFGDVNNNKSLIGYTTADSATDLRPNNSNYKANVSKTFPTGDDGRAHNSYFGMMFSIEFLLTEDYLGPLEYVFYGDDDMWVFLDNTLVCDIGGVHSSVGEYVNLWDWIGAEKGNGTHHHTLTFFYTERGASGSTCYMNFTLPSVTGINIEQKATSLRVEKKVVGESDPTQEFEFDINIYDSDGTQVKDDYAYTKYDAEGNKLDSDLVLHDGSSFTLKNGEYIIIDYLPFGTRYTVTERDPTGYNVSSKINGVVQLGSEATGTIIKDVVNQVLFTNTIDKVDMTLQKLDVSGTPLTGAVFSLTDSNGNLVNFIINSDGYYTVPTESTQLFDSGGLYYLALARDTDYVIGADTSKLSDPNAFYLAQLQNKTSVSTQQYRVTINSDGSCSFYNMGANKYIDHENAKIDNSTKLGHWIDDDSPTRVQRWFLILNENGSFKLKPKRAVVEAASAVVDLSGNSKVNGTQIILYEDNASDAQQWRLVPVNEKEATATTTEIQVGSDGVLHLSGLFPGTYTLGEITAPYGYDKLDGDIKIKVAKDGTVTVVDSNNPLVSVDDSDSGLVLKIKNIKTVKELTLKKAVVGSDTEEKFEFDVSYSVDGGDTIRQTVKLQNGESTVIKIPDGAQVTVAEKANRDFTVNFDSNMPIEVNGNICTFTISENTTLTAVNTAAGIVIPATGGSGTYMYTIAGATMIFVSLALMYKRKRSRKGKIGIL